MLNKLLLCSTENYIKFSIKSHNGEEYIYINLTESCYCAAEINTTLHKRQRDSLFNKLCWETDLHMGKSEVGPLPHTIYKINAKWIKDLSVIAKAIKLLEEGSGKGVHDGGHMPIHG